MESVHEPCEYTNNTAENHAHQLDETPAPGETDGGRKKAGREEKKKCFWRWPFGLDETDGGRKETGIEEKKKCFWRWPALALRFPCRRTAKRNLVKAEKKRKRVAGTSRRHDKGTVPFITKNHSYILRCYKIGPKLGKGGFGLVYAGTRRKDGLKVAVKFSLKPPNMPYITVPGHPKRLPLEIGLTLTANKCPRSPQIIKLLDWQEYTDHYIMVMERPLPCMDLLSFMELHGGTLNEDTARHVMRQVIRAANVCCENGVYHRDIKPENLLVNQDTMEVKLIHFGCGALMKESAFKFFCGTREYIPPEFKLTGKYHAKPMTVWSLGILLFEMVCGDFPTAKDLYMTAANIWTKPGLSQECCKLICDCLQPMPKKRLTLEKMHLHDWFKVMDEIMERTSENDTCHGHP
ncbi:serine/threonine-protein kinase pim-2-like [Sinocyclocheilus anshuiensis]|uniref:serine/threonine-protein kinase pim-2-like n=1 Tax=Sinocyclocheilus anshuiensis TaxID=1608454 RepID=UPI0007B81ACB|nr:PREDICTED: serine/threonine-protein kinase pim-2-like [Sinocyclocheilus anshuiensis]